MKNVLERINEFEIIDFHTHPFLDNNSNICAYKDSFDVKCSEIKKYLPSLGISKIAGSVIRTDRESFENPLDKILKTNRDALALSEMLGDFYIPGFHVHPDYVEESIDEIRFMAARGIRLIGELVPYHDSWDRYDHKGLLPILDEAERHGMTVSFHTMELDSIEAMVASHPNVNFVAAHPGEKNQVLFHVDLMKKYKNLYLDLSGTGIFRYHALRYMVSEVGSERILFGTDYPTCNPGVYVGGVLSEPLSDRDFENIFSLNAKRLLQI